MFARPGSGTGAERRRGQDRRDSVAHPDAVPVLAASSGGLRATVAAWPLDVPEGVLPIGRDAWAAVVRESIEHYRSGRADAAAAFWCDDVVWRLNGAGPLGGDYEGREGVFRYHAELSALTDGTFRQTLLAVEGALGPVVSAYLRTRARRNGRTLDIPTMIVFELSRLRIRRVTEMPGDPAAWERFWA